MNAIAISTAGLSLVLLLAGCSKVLYWDQTNTLTNITGDRQIEQIQNLKKSDPMFDSFLSFLLLDWRLVAETNGMGYVTGADEQYLRTLPNIKEIWGNTDVNEDIELSSWAALYALRYNRNLLGLTGRTALFVGPDDRQRTIIENITGESLE